MSRPCRAFRETPPLLPYGLRWPCAVSHSTTNRRISSDRDGLSASATDPEKLVDAVFAGPENNAPAPTAMIYHPRTGKTMAKLQDGQGLPLIYPTEVANVPKMMTTSVPIDETVGANSANSSIITGYFPHTLVGMRTGLRIDVLKEQYGEFMQPVGRANRKSARR